MLLPLLPRVEHFRFQAHNSKTIRQAAVATAEIFLPYVLIQNFEPKSILNVTVPTFMPFDWCDSEWYNIHMCVSHRPLNQGGKTSRIACDCIWTLKYLRARTYHTSAGSEWVTFNYHILCSMWKPCGWQPVCTISNSPSSEPNNIWRLRLTLWCAKVPKTHFGRFD